MQKTDAAPQISSVSSVSRNFRREIHTRPLTKGQRRSVRSLVRRCCNFEKSCCLLLDDGTVNACPQLDAQNLICGWFVEALLAGDRKLYQELRGVRAPNRTCSVCGKRFTAGSNRAKFCPYCSKARRRQKEAARQRELYHRSSTHLEN